jgi:hypothetical protein
MDVTVKAPPEMKYDDGAKVQPRMLEITLRFDLTARNVAITGNKLPGIVEAAAAAGQRALKDAYGTEGIVEGDWRYFYGPWAFGRVINE